jgi:hypothetical protein
MKQKTKKNTPFIQNPAPPAMVVVENEHRDLVNTIVREFSLKNTKEAMEIIVSVAITNRFQPAIDEDGNDTLLDLWKEQSEKISGNRKVDANTRRIKKLQRQIAELKKLQAEAKQSL